MKTSIELIHLVQGETINSNYVLKKDDFSLVTECALSHWMIAHPQFLIEGGIFIKGDVIGC